MTEDTIHHTETDTHTGTTTTGHDWDGIKELNTPLPRWWLWTFYACIVWAMGYWVVYPAWPGISGFTEGMFGWHSRTTILQDLEGLKQIRAPGNAKLTQASLAEIEKSPELLGIARATAAPIFANNCAPCHGAGAAGAKGYPNLNDDDWLWGGKLEDIQLTLQHGIRWDADKDTRVSAMPAFGKDGILKPEEISATADFVRTLSGLSADKPENVAKGKAVFAENCAACHGETGLGNQELGAPNLADKVWLYGSDKASIVNRINMGGGGVMPAWSEKFDATAIKALTVYVHSLGGGK